MCGRASNSKTADELAATFRNVKHAELLLDLGLPRYNLAPTQLLPAIRAGEDGDEWAALRWGLIPFWAKDPSIGNRMINARADTVEEKPAFKAAFKKRRCLIPITGFYEWQKIDAKRKQPFHIHTRDEEIFTVAGLWERWKSPDGFTHETCTILTTEPNELMAEIHDRMPVLVGEDERDLWLHEDDPGLLRHVLRPYDASRMEAYPVSSYVSNVRNEGPECYAPIEGPEPGEQITLW